MNKWLRIFIVATLTPIGASAELLVPTFSGIRPFLNKGARVTPVIFREEQGPGYGKDQPYQQIGDGMVVITPPPNLTPEHVRTLGVRLNALVEKEQAATGGDPTITRQQVQVLMKRIQQIDRSFVDPIPPEKWDEIIGKMGEEAEKAFKPAKGNWDEVVVKMLKTAVGYAKAGLVFPGSPAERAGLKEDDVIELVGGPDTGWVGTADKDINEIVKRILGKEGTEVQLIVRRDGGPLRRLHDSVFSTRNSEP